MDPRLVDAVTERGIGRRLDRQQFPAGPAPHPEHRVHDGLVGHPEPVQQHGDGVHQHRRVVGDDLQGGTESSRVVVAVHGNPGIAEGPVLTESAVGLHQRRRRQPAQRRPVHRRGHRRVGTGRVAVRPAVGRHVGPREPDDRVLAQRRRVGRSVDACARPRVDLHRTAPTHARVPALARTSDISRA